jgi:hypothetical protein
MTELEAIVRILDWLGATKTPPDIIVEAQQLLRDKVKGEQQRNKTG